MTRSISTRLAILLGALLLPEQLLAATYPCPSDPGFCYRDVADDGCFDAGTDEGPINTEIEMSSSFPPVPPPGSIICPPSVKDLTASGSPPHIRLATPAGSSILFYAARVNTAGVFETMSGDRVLLGGKLLGGAFANIDSQGNIDLEADIKLPTNSSNLLAVDTASGDLTVAPKTKFRSGSSDFHAPLGNVTFGAKSGVFAGRGSDVDISIVAGGNVDMTNTKIRTRTRSAGGSSVVEIIGANVTVHEKLNVKSNAEFDPRRIDITATAGDVTIDQLLVNTDTTVTIAGTNVTIGLPQSGKIRQSRIVQKLDIPSVQGAIVATGAISVANLLLKSTDDFSFQTTGATIDVLSSKLQGRKATPTIDVTAGPGSTCDLTGSSIKNAALVTSCDTVIGP